VNTDRKIGQLASNIGYLGTWPTSILIFFFGQSGGVLTLRQRVRSDQNSDRSFTACIFSKRFYWRTM